MLLKSTNLYRCDDCGGVGTGPPPPTNYDPHTLTFCDDCWVRWTLFKERWLGLKKVA